MGGMGMSKHRKSGSAGKSPKARHRAELEAQMNDRKAEPARCRHQSVREALRD